MENAIGKQLLQEQVRLQDYYERVATLRDKFREEDKVLASLKHKIAKEQQLKSRRKYLSSLIDDVRLRKGEQDYKLTKTEDELLFHFSELLKNKYKIEQLLGSNEDEILSKQQTHLSSEIDIVINFNSQ